MALQKAKVLAAAAHVTALRVELRAEAEKKEQGAKDLSRQPDGTALAAWPDFAFRTDRHIRNLRNEANEAQQAADITISQLVEANRGVKLLENLKQSARNQWQRESDRELGIFADEASLVRLQSLKRRARSSAG